MKSKKEDKGRRKSVQYLGVAPVPHMFTHSGNSSQVSDGAAAVLLMKRSIAMQKGLPILGVFRYNSPEDNVKQIHTLNSACSGNEPQLLGVRENALGIREWLESKGHRYIVTPEKERTGLWSIR
ncbi:hypothetical protein H5410_001136 [Solanum commersonii]|uniref:Uncharacterized protein n=1 Tax=Solanum commersonii TaxID=4109 RepID=A0A9J6AYV6_SOLCO|nr:hypothetical protein H5410_001136 [Solanum commersonii]